MTGKFSAFCLLGCVSLGPGMSAQILDLAPLVVTATRAPVEPARVLFSVAVLEGTALRAAPAATLDGALQAVPGFSLFRRGNSLTANPTAQGVSLRGLGPSGASRSLVLLDGIPLNDPFGGWVSWSKVPRESLARTEIVRGGGGTVWGNAALGGVVQLFTESPGPTRVVLLAGDFSTRSAEFSISQPVGRGAVQLSGRDFSTAGFALVASEDRGPVDLAAWSRHHWLATRWSQPVGDAAELTVTGRTFAEKRGNGTAYQGNASRENFGAVTLAVKATPAFHWSASTYVQDQSFASSFSAVNPARTGETPASNQFAVPATAFGAAWSGVLTGADGASTSFGADLRRVRGESQEYFTFINGDFTRQRVAGGTQDFAGMFVWHERPLPADWRLTLGARLDDWRESEGHRRENDRTTGNVLRDEQYADRVGVEFSPSVGLVWQATDAWRGRIVVQQAFRRPTLNELYRPFRVGNVITEANAALSTEHLTCAEVGADYTAGSLKLGAAVFWNELRDAVSNVTLVHGLGTFPVVGFVPTGGLGRQRLNLDRIRVRGLELSAQWQPVSVLSLTAACLYTDATVRRATVSPGLAGRRLAQVPQQSVTAGAIWRAPGGWLCAPRLRWLGRQFEDDENRLMLGAVLLVDLTLSHACGRHGEIFLTMENLGDARIETGRSADGLVNTGTPRLALAGMRCAW